MIVNSTAVVRLHNGSFQHVALIDGDSSYVELLSRLATGPMDRTPDHFDTAWEKWEYVKQRTLRHLNKLRGLPATPDTAVLANMISSLHNATQSWLGPEWPITAMVVSSPDRVRLSEEELTDVFDYLKLKDLLASSDSNWHEELYSASAAYAGYGQGLCTNHTDAYKCEEEEWYFPYQRLLHIDHSEESLSATIEGLRTARDGAMDSGFIDPTLGTGSSRWQDDYDGSQYIQAITHRIRELVMRFKRVFKPKITALVLTGSRATGLGFKAAIRDALQDYVASEDVLDVLVEDSDLVRTFSEYEWHQFFEFATARGAAEIAKRRQEGPVDCRQTDECKRRRELEQSDKRKLEMWRPRADL